MIRRQFLLVMLLFSSLVNANAPLLQATSVGEMQAKYVVQLFMSACNASLGDKDVTEQVAATKEFQEPPPMATRMFLMGQNGVAWSKSTAMGPFAISVTDNGLCSVFAAEADTTFIRKYLESWLPPKELGFSVKFGIGEQDKKGMSSFNYQISKDGKPDSDWMLSTAILPDANFQAVISYIKR